MLNNPNIALLASLNRWIVSILTFHFELRHVPGKQHGPDGLSRRPPQPDDDTNPEDFNDWVDQLYGFTHLLNPPIPAPELVRLLQVFAMETLASPLGEILDPDRLEPNIKYSSVLRSKAAILADK